MRENRREYWAKTIAEQEASGMGVEAFCRARGIGKASFYPWRRRLRHEPSQAVSFARIETKAAPDWCASPLELIFATGERLRVGKGADAATLQLLVAALRA
jgi:hypothetical protein